MRPLAPLLAAGLALVGAGCNDDEDDAGSTTTTATAAPSTTSSSPPESTTTTAVEADPLDAAAAFLATFFPGTRATLGEFQAGDARSGEVEVLRPSEGGGTANVGATLLLRLDDAIEWRVIGAAHPSVTIEAPENGAEVAAGPLTVSGVGRGFEATLVVQAFTPDGAVVAQAVGSGGALAEPLPYEVELDLSGVDPGTELVLITAGGTGLDGDPGEFSAVRVTVG